MVFGLLQPAPQRSTPEGQQLLHSMQNALGGAKNIGAIHDYEELIRAEAWDAAGNALGDVRKRTRWIRQPNLLRIDQIGPRGTYVLYFDGTSGWEILPDVSSVDRYKTTGKAIELVGGELQFAKGYLSGFELNLWLADQHDGWAATAPRPNVLRIEHGDSATDFTLDETTKLPLSSAGVSLADPDRPVPSQMRYGGWKEYAGVRFPMRRANYLSDVKRGEVITETIRVNTGLRPQDLADKPANLAPDIPRR
jgi:hypothetical protein